MKRNTRNPLSSKPENFQRSDLFPVGIYVFKVNKRNFRTRCEICSKLTIKTLEQRKICSKLTIKTPEQRQWRRSGVLIVNFDHISHLVLVFLLLTLEIKCRLGSLYLISNNLLVRTLTYFKSFL